MLGSTESNPGPLHTKAATHLLQYLHGIRLLGLIIGVRSPILLEIYVDASYIEEGEARSQIGYCLRLNQLSGMVYLRSIRDILVSMSLAEAELRALKEATMEAIWFRLFLEELGFP